VAVTIATNVKTPATPATHPPTAFCPNTTKKTCIVQSVNTSAVRNERTAAGTTTCRSVAFGFSGCRSR
jgi:hypothetical protein